MIAKVLALLGLIAVSTDAICYEQATHALITNSAFHASRLPGDLLHRLGLDGFAPFGVRSQYAELLDSSPTIHEKQPFEQQIIDALSAKLGFVDDANRWLMFGAIREDDNPAEDPATPQDIAPGLKRPLHHFYDPYRDRALDIVGISQLDPDVHKNPDWAIGSRNSFFDPNVPEPSRRNTFTIIDAREAMFRALTMMTVVDGTYTSIAPDDPAVSQQWRQAYWATTFRALGDVLHLNQDMAQPQHTRNEAHSGKYCFFASACPAGHTSVYEKYINARALRFRSFNSLAPFGAPVDITLQPLQLDGYPIPDFARYPDYWATTPSSPVQQGQGLAEFSNRAFFTAAKNLGDADNEYWFPPRDATKYQIVQETPTRWDGASGDAMAPVQVYYGTVTDTFEDRLYMNVPMTTFGVWDQFLKEKSKAPRYSLNRRNYDAMADMLLPRAVAYSAGLINYFFRGRLEISLPDEGVFAIADHGTKDGFKTLRVKVKNTTSDFTSADGKAQPQPMSAGTFFAVIRYHQDRKYVDSLEALVGTDPCDDFFEVMDSIDPSVTTACRDGVERIMVSKPIGGILDVNQEKTLKFDFSDSAIPYGMTDVVLQIVYRGALGSESDAVAAASIDIPEPTYFTYHNASDYIHIGNHVYARTQVEADPGLLSLVRPTYCVDNRVSPPKLFDGCLTPFKLDVDLSFGDLANPLVRATELPSRHLLRVVYLTSEDPVDETTKARRSGRMHVTVRSHGTGSEQRNEKALLYQHSTCLPLDPFDIPPRHAQLVMQTPTSGTYRLGGFNALRGVNGWYSTSCVVNGDEAVPGTPDDRNDAMGELNPESDEIRPVPVTIHNEYL